MTFNSKNVNFKKLKKQILMNLFKNYNRKLIERINITKNQNKNWYNRDSQAAKITIMNNKKQYHKQWNNKIRLSKILKYLLNRRIKKLRKSMN